MIFYNSQRNEVFVVLLVEEVASELQISLVSNEGRFQRAIEVKSDQVNIFYEHLACLIIIKILLSEDLIDFCKILQLRSKFNKRL